MQHGSVLEGALDFLTTAGHDLLVVGGDGVLQGRLSGANLSDSLDKVVDVADAVVEALATVLARTSLALHRAQGGGGKAVLTWGHRVCSITNEGDKPAMVVPWLGDPVADVGLVHGGVVGNPGEG